MSLREPPMMVAEYDCATKEQTIREFTEEEYADFDERIKVDEQHQAEEQQKHADAVAGRQKLLDLGLSEAEVDALVGPAPIQGAPDVEAPDPA
tara:strand:+ start:2497 stop:2775 length:279 start_codon:yes stop_codon:yes gene_type:complete